MYNTAFHETEYYHHNKIYIITLKHFDFIYKHKQNYYILWGSAIKFI